MLVFPEAKTIISYVFTLAAGLDDYRNRKIRNELSFTFLVFSFLFYMTTNHSDVLYILWKSVLALLLCILYVIGTIGGGDFKILLALLLISMNSVFLVSLLLTLLLATVISRSKEGDEIPILSLYAPIYLSISMFFTLVYL